MSQPTSKANKRIFMPESFLRNEKTGIKQTERNISDFFLISGHLFFSGSKISLHLLKTFVCLRMTDSKLYKNYPRQNGKD